MLLLFAFILLLGIVRLFFLLPFLCVSLYELSVMNDNGIDRNVRGFAFLKNIVHFEYDVIEFLLHAAHFFLFVEDSQLLSENRLVVFIVSFLILFLGNVKPVSLALFLLELDDKFIYVYRIFLAVLSEDAKQLFVFHTDGQ